MSPHTFEDLSIGDVIRFFACQDPPLVIVRRKAEPDLYICWPWKGGCKPKGYGRFTWNGKKTAAHRVAYYMHHGTIDPTLDVDHTCRVLDCVNPHHLEQVTPEVNRQRRIDHHKALRGVG